MSQNTSSAVMQQRIEAHDSLDDFPTPPWATRALIEHVLTGNGWGAHHFGKCAVREPACNRGFMARPLAEYFETVLAADVHDYGCGYSQQDFLFPGPMARTEFVISNPPFRLAAEFVRRGLEVTTEGVAMLVRCAFTEGAERHETLFKPHPPLLVAQFVERVPMVRGRCDGKASTATAYCWIVWDSTTKPRAQIGTRFIWIPPCRKRLERAGDYDLPMVAA